MARINRGLDHGVWNVTPEAVNKAVCATTGVAIWEECSTMFLEDSLANSFSGVQDRAIRFCAAGMAEKREAQRKVVEVVLKKGKAVA